MGSIGPKGKISKSRRDKRRAQTWKIATPTLVKCDTCGSLMQLHRVCKSCGKYKQSEIIVKEV